MQDSDQKTYLENGIYEKAFTVFPPEYLSFLHKEELFFKENIARGSSVLDVGCGELRTTVPLAVHVGIKGKLVGIDFDKRMYALASEKSKVLKNVEVRLMEARDLDKLKMHFDYVIFPFEFIGLLPQEDQVPVLEKARGKLKPRGKVLATVFSEYAPPIQMKLYRKLWEKRIPRVEGRFVYGGNGYRAEVFTKKNISEIFSHAGFVPEVEALTRMGYSIKTVPKI